MQPDDEFGAETGSGPPPDPSVREWRHPSEIAAAAAAAARPLPAPHGASGSLLVTFGGATLGVVAIVGLALYLVGASGSTRGLSQTANPSTGDRSPVLSTTILTSPAVGERSEPTRTESAAGAESVPEEGDASVHAGEPATVEATTTSATEPAPETSATVLETPAGAFPPGALLDPTLRPPAAEAVDGVFTLQGGRLHRVSGYLAMDGMIFTSASSLGADTRVVVKAGTVWAEADLLGTDWLTDTAILSADDPPFSVDGSIATATTERPGPPIPGTEVHIGPATDGAEPATGVVIGTEQVAAGSDGRKVYGTIRTSISRGDTSAGSPLIDADTGAVIGIVLDSSEYLVSGVPLDRIAAIGQTFLYSGVPAIEWLGISGTARPGGGVELTEVTAASPAEEAGLRAGETILALGTTPIDDMAHFVHLIREEGVGSTVPLDVLGLGGGPNDVRTVGITIGTRPLGPPPEDSPGS